MFLCQWPAIQFVPVTLTSSPRQWQEFLGAFFYLFNIILCCCCLINIPFTSQQPLNGHVHLIDMWKMKNSESESSSDRTQIKMSSDQWPNDILSHQAATLEIETLDSKARARSCPHYNVIILSCPFGAGESGRVSMLNAKVDQERSRLTKTPCPISILIQANMQQNMISKQSEWRWWWWYVPKINLHYSSSTGWWLVAVKLKVIQI